MKMMVVVVVMVMMMMMVVMRSANFESCSMDTKTFIDHSK